jgi:hypothetical protein
MRAQVDPQEDVPNFTASARTELSKLVGEFSSPRIAVGSVVPATVANCAAHWPLAPCEQVASLQ